MSGRNVLYIISSNKVSLMQLEPAILTMSSFKYFYKYKNNGKPTLGQLRLVSISELLYGEFTEIGFRKQNSVVYSRRNFVSGAMFQCSVITGEWPDEVIIR